MRTVEIHAVTCSEQVCSQESGPSPFPSLVIPGRTDQAPMHRSRESHGQVRCRGVTAVPVIPAYFRHLGVQTSTSPCLVPRLRRDDVSRRAPTSYFYEWHMLSDIVSYFTMNYILSAEPAVWEKRTRASCQALVRSRESSN